MRSRQRFRWEIDAIWLLWGGALMTRARDFFRGSEMSFSPCNTTKKSGPGLKMLRNGKLRLLNKNPLENLAISGWLLKMQGGVAVCCVVLAMVQKS
jgi:hypothetical protein